MVLAHHVYKGTPLLPAAALLNIFVEGSERLGRSVPAVLEKFQFINGVRCFTAAPQKLQAVLHRVDGGWECRLTQEFCNRAGQVLDPARLCCTAHAPAEHPAFDDWGWQSSPATGWRTVHFRAGNSNRMGPSLQGLKRLNLQSDRGWGEIVAAAETPWKSDSTAPWRFSPGVLDAALVACNMWVFTQRPGTMQIPLGMRRIWLGHNPMPGSQLEESFHVQDLTETTAAYDIRVRDESGCIILKIDDYQCVLIREPGETPIYVSDPN
jgi:hypothetical protein